MKAKLNKYGFSRGQIIGLALFVLIALSHRFIANENYLFCVDGNKLFFSAKESCALGLTAFIPYSAQTIDKKNRNTGPFSKQNVSSIYFRHWLGTDKLGRDVLAGLIYGTYIALKIGVLAIFLTTLIGIFFGYLSGYIGDKGFRLERKLLLSCLLFLALAIFYFIYCSGISQFIAGSIALVIILVMILKSDSNNVSDKTMTIPFDMITMRIIEVFKAIPDLFLVLVLIGMFEKANFTNVILIIALIRWPTITRYLRPEIMKTKEEDFVQSARALGLSNFVVFKNHILPLAISPIIIASAFGFSVAILIESTLSFLGIGVPLDQVTWGSILNESRTNFSSWWLAFFPGLMIFLSVLLFNSIGDRLSDYFRGDK